MDLLRALDWRYAVRRFADERIGEEQLQDLLTATRMSASSYGLQPYRLVVVESEAVRRRLLPHSMGQDKVVHCSHLIVFAAQVDVGDGMVDRYMARLAEVRGLAADTLKGMSEHIKSALAAMTPAQRMEWAHQQAYIALGNLLTCAALMDIDSCPMGGIEAEGYDRELGLAEEGLATAVVCAIGLRHPEDSSAYLEKVRFAHREMVKVI
ncbi:NAD(P)H-dependent oxidoreductase [Microbulbifer taiwanensis]|uniref:NAD(P)H-dependent oxidoreductase n=1 Tax=Microbulbifer taiwanensis TaxID=986746 RepID=A0ABW1YLR7_9GAMM|nr:NAD(P)H-dependent oxidoreductase [Microbulbifer taiwanensis]